MGGRLIRGQWHSEESFADKDGSFRREETSFRDWVEAPGKTSDGQTPQFMAEKDRYHLYVSHACPWAHRAMIMRNLKGLQDIIGVSVVHPYMLDLGWSLDDDFMGATGDQLYGLKHLSELYVKAKEDYTGKVTVPVLWDKKNETIVNNESAELIRIFNERFNSLTGNVDDYYPEELRSEIDNINERVYHNINNGVYKAGFAENQQAYEDSVRSLFDALDWVEDHLSQTKGKYLFGERLTEADIRLFTTLIRFDAVYYTHFKCNVKRIKDYPHLSDYVANLYAMEAIKSTIHFDHIKHHYFYSHQSINPFRIVPLGPETPVKGF